MSTEARHHHLQVFHRKTDCLTAKESTCTCTRKFKYKIKDEHEALKLKIFYYSLTQDNLF